MADSSNPPETTETNSSHTHEEAGSSPSKIQTGDIKVDVLLKSAGDAPIMKKKKWSVNRTQKVGGVIDFIRKYIKCQEDESIFLYVNQAFAPALDTEVGVLYDCFSTEGKLLLHYCKSQAWG